MLFPSWKKGTATLYLRLRKEPSGTAHTLALPPKSNGFHFAPNEQAVGSRGGGGTTGMIVSVVYDGDDGGGGVVVVGGGGAAADDDDAVSLSLTRTGHVVVAVCLAVIGSLGFLNNLAALTLFCRYRALRSPVNCMLASISVSDLLVSVLGAPLSFAASTQGRWLLGRAGCVWYGFVNACLGTCAHST